MSKVSKVLVTGCAGFIGFHLSKKLLATENIVVGLDNLNEYYDLNLKKSRLALLQKFTNFHFIQNDIINASALEELFELHNITHVVHLAAQAGVRYSITNPQSYVQSNLVGFANILECCRQFAVQHLVYASSSSVYGLDTDLPFTESHKASHPLSLYAATKRSNEILAHSYSSMYQLSTTGTRFFTVYGPWGRPDMALFKFTHNILHDLPIDLFNGGDHIRDFTYIDDIVNALELLIYNPATANIDFDCFHPDLASSNAPWQILNIGNNNPMLLTRYVELIEGFLGKKAKVNNLPMQQGDVYATFASVDRLVNLTGYKPSVKLEDGIKKFIDWYIDYYQVKSKEQQWIASQ